MGLLAKAKIAFRAGPKIAEGVAAEGAEGDAELGSDVEEFPLPAGAAAVVVTSFGGAPSDDHGRRYGLLRGGWVTAATAAAAFMYDAIQWLRTGSPPLPEEKDQQHEIRSVLPYIRDLKPQASPYDSRGPAEEGAVVIPLQYLACAPGPGKEWGTVNHDVRGLLPTDETGWKDVTGDQKGHAEEYKKLLAMAEAAYYAEQVKRKLLMLLPHDGAVDPWQAGGRLDPAAKNYIVNGDHWATYGQ